MNEKQYVQIITVNYNLSQLFINITDKSITEDQHSRSSEI